MSLRSASESLELRVSLLERSLTSANAQIAELTQALAEYTNLAPGQERTPPEPMMIDADSVSPFAAGFYRPEQDNTGRAFRWTGRGDFFEFRLGVDRSQEWAFRLEVQPNPHVPAKALRAYADFAPIPSQDDASGRFVTGIIPPRPFSKLLTLTFLLPATFVPRELDPSSQDDRRLGIAFFALQLDPVGAAAPEPASEEGELVTLDLRA